MSMEESVTFLDSEEKSLIEVRGLRPKVAANVFVASGAKLIGDVEVEKGTSIWFNAVIRGDVSPIRIGMECNIQDGVIIHGTYQKTETELANRVSIGHAAVLHGCSVGNETLIGMGAMIMDKVRIGERCLIGAGSLLTEGMEIADNSLALGRPAKVVRQLRENELELVSKTPDNYLLYKNWFQMEESSYAN